MAKKRVISISVLPGQPTDGSGIVCIHLFIRDKRGLFVEPHVLHQEVDESGNPTGRMVAKPTRGMLACDRKLTVNAVTKNGVTKIVHRTDDPRAVTCLKCKETEQYKSMMSTIEQMNIPIPSDITTNVPNNVNQEGT